ncbi:MAG: DUF393 domain-containing protein [Candidatus Dadabacteria bacterium]|nr:DUF393 domain-containing protein [Candidatus Dadabacteria bacterium]NIQ15234.1 DUF393 domain-containing protein [Candidatus Dadabacteria bacterium]
MTNIDRPIIFFDGVCGLCNRFVNIILDADKKGTFYFSPLQGKTAKHFITFLNSNNLKWSMLYVDESGIHDESTATLKILQKLGGVWGILGLLIYIPNFIRNPVYRLIARYRYRWFGKWDSCRVPSQQEKENFLD